LLQKKKNNTKILLIKNAPPDVDNLSSTEIRNLLTTLKKKSGDKPTVENLIKLIGKGVYCQLQKYPYIAPTANYGDICTKPDISVNNRATIENFIYMQENGMTGMSDFKTALDEINGGQKKTHWIWYIIPSNLNPISSNATFFKIDKTSDSKGSLTAEQYLSNDSLRKNYITIINAIYKQYYAKFMTLVASKDVDVDARIKILRTIMNSDEDYNKLINSIGIFYPVLIGIYSSVYGFNKIKEFVNILVDFDANLKKLVAAPAPTHPHIDVSVVDPNCLRGIYNYSSFCYMNSSFQLLFSIDSIRKFLTTTPLDPKRINGLDITKVIGTKEENVLNKDKLDGSGSNISYAIIQNLLPIFKKLISNVQKTTKPPVNEFLDNARLLAHYTGLATERNNTAEFFQHDAHEFLLKVLDALTSENEFTTPSVEIKNQIQFNNYITFTCKNNVTIHSPNFNLSEEFIAEVINKCGDFGITVNKNGVMNAVWNLASEEISSESVANWLADKAYNDDTKHYLTTIIPVDKILKNSSEQQNLIEKYKIHDDGKLISVRQDSRITSIMLSIELFGDNIQDSINNYSSEQIPDSIIRNCEGVCDCKQIKKDGKLDTDIRQKDCIFIPDTQKYIIIQLKRFYQDPPLSKNLKKKEDSVTPNKEITIDNKKFKLKGVVCQRGSLNSGHYVYVDCNEKGDPFVIYSDTSCFPPTAYNINTEGYVFLYERMYIPHAGGSNTISPKSNPNPNLKPNPIPISKSTIKVTSNKKPNKRTRTKTNIKTRKHENKITHKLKENNSKNKNKKKTRKHIHKIQ
jgi:ubiquitin C-terminal hydrolase/uncharacterized protein (DUF1810 family)